MTATTTDAAPTADTTAPVASPTPDAATGSETPSGSTDAPQTTDTAAPEAPAAPERYEFALPEGMAVDEKLVERVTPLLQKHKLSQEAANELATAYAEHLQELTGASGEAFNKAYADRRQAEVATMLESDMEALKADKEIGGAKFDTVQKRVMDFIGAEGTAEFRAFVDSNGIANNPEFVRVLDRAIRYTATDTGETPASGGGSGPRPMHERMYENANKHAGGSDKIVRRT
jgi:hypothetical protein